MSSSFVAGVDGCKSGWVVVLLHTRTRATLIRTLRTFTDVWRLPESPSIIAVDIPIGLLDAAAKGGRDCDRVARAMLGRPRASSVFSPPVRAALRAKTHAAASAANERSSAARIGISIQAFGICPKIAEVDALLTPARQRRVFEVHPELSFYEMANGKPQPHAKKTAAGRSDRLRMLARHFPNMTTRAPGAATDDVVDAYAACWTALRIRRGIALSTSTSAPRDARGLRMEIWR